MSIKTSWFAYFNRGAHILDDTNNCRARLFLGFASSQIVKSTQYRKAKEDVSPTKKNSSRNRENAPSTV